MCTVQEKELLYGKLVELLQRNDSISCLWLDSGQDLFDTVIVQLLNPKLHNFVRELYAAEKITEDVFRNTTEIKKGNARVRSFLELMVRCLGETATKDFIVSYLNLLIDRLKSINAKRPETDTRSFRLMLMEYYRQCVCYVQLFAWDPATSKKIAECYIPRNFYSVTMNQGGDRKFYNQIKYEAIMEYYDTTNRNQAALGGLITFVSGESGIGKSTLAKQIIFDWVQKKTLKTINLLIYVPLGDCASHFERLIDIAIYYYSKNNSMLSAEIIDYFKKNFYSPEILLLFDGLDEFKGKCPELDSIIEMQGEWLNYHLIITSKYRKRNVEYDCQIDLQGITTDDIEEYIQKTLNHLEKTTLLSFMKLYREVPFYQELCRLPVLMNHICSVVDLNNGQLPATIAKLFEDIYKCFIHRYANLHQKKISDIEQHLNVTALGRMAMDGILEGRCIWSLEMANKYGIDKETMAVKLGFLRLDTVYQPVSGIITDTAEFIHPIFQDYFAAQYIKDIIQDAEFLQKFAKVMTGLDFFRDHPHLLSFAFNTSALAASKIISGLIQVLYDIYTEFKNSSGCDKYSYLDVCFSDINQLYGYVFKNFYANSTEFPSHEYIFELPCELDEFLALQLECALRFGRTNVYKWHSMLPLLSDYMRQIIVYNPYVSQIIRMQIDINAWAQRAVPLDSIQEPLDSIQEPPDSIQAPTRFKSNAWAQRAVPLDSIQVYSLQEKQPENLQKFLLEQSIQLLEVSGDIAEITKFLAAIEKEISLKYLETIIINGDTESVLHVFEKVKMHSKQIKACVANINRPCPDEAILSSCLETLKLFDKLRCLELIFSENSTPQFEILNDYLPQIFKNPSLGTIILINNSAHKAPSEFAANWTIDWRFDTLQIQNFGRTIFIHALNGIQSNKCITKLSLCPLNYNSMGIENVQMNIPVADFLKNCLNLRLLDLSYFNLSNDHLNNLLDIVETMEELVNINLSGNPAVGENFSNVVDRLLMKPETLIAFAHCNLTDDALQIIYEKLKSKQKSVDQSRRQLWLRGNRFTDEAKSDFAEIFQNLDLIVDF